MRSATGKTLSTDQTTVLLFNDGHGDFALVKEDNAYWFGPAGAMSVFTKVTADDVIANGQFMSADDICDYLEGMPIVEIDGDGWDGIEKSNSRLSDWVLENTASEEELSDAADMLTTMDGNIIEKDGCTFVYGKVPVRTAIILMERSESGDVSDQRLAAMAGATLVLGSKQAIEAMHQSMNFPRPAQPKSEPGSPAPF